MNGLSSTAYLFLRWSHVAGSAPDTPPRFEALDLESASGRYHTVTCLDVMIHYPQASTKSTPQCFGLSIGGSVCCLLALHQASAENNVMHMLLQRRHRTQFVLSRPTCCQAVRSLDLQP